jgi:hypothetical protein
MSVLLQRDTKVYLEKGSTIWEIPVLEGFSFSQGNTTSEVVLNEMSSDGTTTRRGRRMFNDALDPAEWSLSTYVRPFVATAGTGPAGTADTTANVHAIEEALWANFIGDGAYTSYAHEDITHGGSSAVFDFSAANLVELGKFNLYFVMGATLNADADYASTTTGIEIYKLTDCTVNEVTINFDVEGIAQLDWTGNANTLTSEPTFDGTTAITEGISSTTNYIRNKLTKLTVGGVSPFDTTYNFTLTGGSVTFANNIQYLTPNTLGEVNTPIGHITGALNISGNFTCYIEPDTASASGDFLADMLSNTSTITNDFDLKFEVGGTGNPSFQMQFPSCHLEIPNVSVEDIISLDVSFNAIPSSITSTNEGTITYRAA